MENVDELNVSYGTHVFPDGDVGAVHRFVIQVTDDNTPEIQQFVTINLVESTSNIDSSANSFYFGVAESDNAHGVFSILPTKVLQQSCP